MIGQIQRYLIIGLAVALVGAIFVGALFRARSAADHLRADAAISRAKGAETALHDAQHVIDTERESVSRANQVAAQYEQDKTDAQARADDLARQLKSGAVRLREPWRTCPAAVPEAAADPGKPAGEADDRAESASRAIRAADDADNQIRALQELLIEERK